jgi:hypothetical protein
MTRRSKSDYSLLYNLSVDVRYRPTFVLSPSEAIDVQDALDSITAELQPRVAKWLSRPSGHGGTP